MKFKFNEHPQQIQHEGKPLFNMEIDENSGNEGMNFISLVKQPATKQPFWKFNKNKKNNKLKFKISNEEKQLLTGVVMLADTPIYRRDEENNEFFVQFPRNLVEKMAFKYMKDQFSQNVNLEHNEEEKVEGVFLVESYLFDEERGIKIPDFLGDVKPGSWIATFKVENNQVWDRVKSGEFEGFSLEGNFGLRMAFSDKKEDNKLKNSILDENLSNNEIYNLLVKQSIND